MITEVNKEVLEGVEVQDYVRTPFEHSNYIIYN